MMARPHCILAAAATLLLAGCQEEPRAQAFFEENAEDRVEVLADCTAGTRRGQECENAKLAEQTLAAKAKRDRRRSILRQTYEDGPSK